MLAVMLKVSDVASVIPSARMNGPGNVNMDLGGMALSC